MAIMKIQARLLVEEIWDGEDKEDTDDERLRRNEDEKKEAVQIANYLMETRALELAKSFLSG